MVSPKLGIGGIQRALTNIGNWFVGKGFTVTLISCKKEEVFYNLDSRIKLIIPTVDHPGEGGNIFLHYLRIVRYLRGEFKKNSAVHIISFGDTFNPLALIAGIGLNKKIHISDRTSPDYKFKPYINFLKKFTYPYSTTFIAQTSRAANWNRQKFGKKLNIEIIPNPARKIRLENVTRKKIVLYIGRFAWEKAPDRLIQAFAAVKERKGYRLIMCGDGPLLPKMQELAKDLKVSNEVDFMGKVSNVDYHLSEASIYVLPSVLEGFPNALCEAMSAGLPSICFDSIPYEDLGVPNQDFLVITDNSVDSLANAIQALIDSEPLRYQLGKSALSINTRLDNDAVCNKFQELISK